MAKRVSTRGLRKNRHYTYEDAGDILGLSPHTVRGWKKLGLIVMTDSIPHIIIGEDLIDFINSRQVAPQKLGPHEFWCCACKGPTTPLGRVAFYTPLTPARGQLEGLCATCEGVIFRFAGVRSLSDLAVHCEIAHTCPSQG